MVLLVLSLFFVVAGILFGLRGDSEKDKLMAVATVGFFGLCSWVFGEQVIAGHNWIVAKPLAIVRLALALTASGSGGAYAAWVYESAPLADRLKVGAFGVAFVGLAIVVIVMAIKAGRLKLQFRKKTPFRKRR